MILRTIILSATLAVPCIAAAEVEKVTLDKMILNPTPLEGVSSSIVSGAMNAEGAFGANALMEDGSVFPPHDHPDSRMSVVLEGTMYLGVGDTVDPAAERAFEAGSVAIAPAGVSHWMAARDGDVRILEIGTGPTTTNFAK